MIEKRKTVSVIVPVYNTEKFLKRCVTSLVNQTYKELEIILVNDGSTDKSAEIIDDFVSSDSRVKRVDHEKNCGLFQARITGVQASRGEYIAFVDSDDYVSVDWFRLLVEKAEKESSDITVGQWCFEYENGYREYLNLDPFRMPNVCLTGTDVLGEFMKQEGRCFSWWVVWNKLYSRSLWDLCEEDYVQFSQEHGHMLMWEDVTFSSNFWSHAKKVVNLDVTSSAYYYYFQHSEGSTARFSVKDKKRGKKYINDAYAAMKFMKNILNKNHTYDLYQKFYEAWYLKCKSQVYSDLVTALLSKNYVDDIVEKFGPIDKSKLILDTFFYENRTQLEDSFEWGELIKREISSEEVDIISFDVFDTLIQRPFLEPTDLFDLLSDQFNKLEKTSSYIDFKNIRISAESECRKLLHTSHPSIEEISLEEIYDYIAENFCFSKATLQSMKKYEVDLEYTFCKPRKYGKELYKLAKYCGKRIIICSDMYLEAHVIEDILSMNGYADFERLYVSSAIKYTKHTGRIFDFIFEDLKISYSQRKRCLHIGDNYQSDVEMPKYKGMKSAHLPKAIDVFKGNNPGIYSGEFYNNVLGNTFHYVDSYWAVHDFSGLSFVYGLLGNKIFDNPFISINRDSDFNMNPYMIGYMTLGPQLLALVRWAERKRLLMEARHIHFVARDGYLVKKAYDIMYADNVVSNYIRLSRKALILADINSISDLYSIIIKSNINNLSPKKLEGYLKPLIRESKLKEVHEQLTKNKLFYDRKFASHIEYEKALKIYIEKAIDLNLLSDYRKELKDYFSEIIQEKDVIFDVGYSGRPEAALSNILGFPVNSLYIHTLKDLADKRQQRYGCMCETFFDYKPAITGVMREHLLMELGPSTIGYINKNGKLEPVFETYEEEYTLSYITKTVQNAALDFISDFKKTYEKFDESIIMRDFDLALPLEYYLHNSKKRDRSIFSTLTFEDDMGTGGSINAFNFWNNEIEQRNQQLLGGTTSASNQGVLENLYADGLFVKAYNWINKKYPYGSKKREFIKKMVRHCMH